jgi:hypothetical protein
MELVLDSVHESVLAGIVSLLDVRSRVCLMCCSRGLHAFLDRVEYWSLLTFEEEAGDDSYHMNATALLSVLKRSHGKAHTIQLARCVLFVLLHAACELQQWMGHDWRVNDVSLWPALRKFTYPSPVTSAAIRSIGNEPFDSIIYAGGTLSAADPAGQGGHFGSHGAAASTTTWTAGRCKPILSPQQIRCRYRSAVSFSFTAGLRRHVRPSASSASVMATSTTKCYHTPRACALWRWQRCVRCCDSCPSTSEPAV